MTPAENTHYGFFTEPEFVTTASGQLALLISPGAFASGTQPELQFGCRLIPITALSTSGITLDVDSTTSAVVVIAKVTENDLLNTEGANGSYNEGPGACAYEPTSSAGIILSRRYEDDPTYGWAHLPGQLRHRALVPLRGGPAQRPGVSSMFVRKSESGFPISALTAAIHRPIPQKLYKLCSPSDVALS